MRDNAPSKMQNRSASLSAVGRLSEKAIRRELHSDAIQHPMTILPLALCILSLIYLVLYAPKWGGAPGAIVLGLCSGVVAAGSLLWQYAVRYPREYAKRVQRLIDLEERERREREGAELTELRATLESGFLGVESIEGLRALNGLVHEYGRLQPVLERKRKTDPLSLSYIGTLAGQTYRQGLASLADALELTRAIHSSNKETLTSEIVALEKEIESLRGDGTQEVRVAMKEETVASHRERLEMIEQQRLRKDKLLHQTDRCEASLARTRIELAGLKADSSEASVNALTEALQSTIAQAREVQEEMRRLGL